MAQIAGEADILLWSKHQRTICGSSDNRIPVGQNGDNAVGRLFRADGQRGCTGTLLLCPDASVDACLVTAGHCIFERVDPNNPSQTLPGFNAVGVEFNVPLSSPATCEVNTSEPRKQFLFAPGIVGVANGQGDDWALIRLLQNDTTGLTAIEEQGLPVVYSFGGPIVPPDPPDPPIDLVIRGYGIDFNMGEPGSTMLACDGPCVAGLGSWNMILQEGSGPLLDIAAPLLEHQVDTCGSNSGSGIALAGTRNILAIHTNGGCAAMGGTNKGTIVWAPRVVRARQLFGLNKLVSDDAEIGGAVGREVAIGPDQGEIILSDTSGFQGQSGLQTGVAYVFVKSAKKWSQVEKLGPPATLGVTGEQFGSALEVSGGFLIVGAERAIEGSVRSGAVYPYRRGIDGAWIEEDRLLPDSLGEDDRFGAEVALQGDFLFVGSPGDDEGGLNNAGAVYVFERLGEVWVGVQRVAPGTPTLSGNFGESLDASGDILVIGAPGEDPQGADSGAVYVFTRDASGFWFEEARLTPADGVTGDKLGESVSVSGGRLAAGARQSGSRSGKVYIFEEDSGTWSDIPSAIITASSGSAGDLLGDEVLLDGDRLLVGASNDDLEWGDDAGSAWVFDFADGLWGETQQIISEDAWRNDNLGRSVSFVGSLIAVGAPGNGNGGAVYVYDVPRPAELIFSDGFESGDTSAWSSTTP